MIKYCNQQFVVVVVVVIIIIIDIIIIDIFQPNINSRKKLMQQKCDGQHIINKLYYIQLNYNT